MRPWQVSRFDGAMLGLLCCALLLASDGGQGAEHPQDIISATRFVHGSPEHGYPGPWALAGFRIGEDALHRLGLRREDAFQLDVVHYAVPEVRYTCVADGVTAATGVSVGKMNLRLEKVTREGELHTVVTDKKSGRQLIYRLIPSFRDRMRDVPFSDFPKAAQELAAMKNEEIFTVEEKPLRK